MILIDNYIDESVLTLLSKRAKNCKAVIYTKAISKKLGLDLEKHNVQYDPIEIQVFNHAHDRFLILDHGDIYHIGASLKDLGKKWFAFSRFDKDAFKIFERLKKTTWNKLSQYEQYNNFCNYSAPYSVSLTWASISAEQLQLF